MAKTFAWTGAAGSRTSHDDLLELGHHLYSVTLTLAPNDISLRLDYPTFLNHRHTNHYLRYTLSRIGERKHVGVPAAKQALLPQRSSSRRVSTL